MIMEMLVFSQRPGKEGWVLGLRGGELRLIQSQQELVSGRGEQDPGGYGRGGSLFF